MKILSLDGIPAALVAALLFGAATPISKLLLGPVHPWLLAGVLYLGSGIGLAIVRRLRPGVRSAISRADVPWLAAAIAFGGVLGPVLLMWGLAHASAASVSLLLSAEGVLTALIAWFVFRENVDRRIALGMGLIVAGAVVLSWPHEGRIEATLPALAIVGACLAWALDNNFTRKIALAGHPHTHAPMDHEHEHQHDEHHRHEHAPELPPGTRHVHPHHHDALAHSHEHFPDAHHRHDHKHE